MSTNVTTIPDVRATVVAGSIDDPAISARTMIESKTPTSPTIGSTFGLTIPDPPASSTVTFDDINDITLPTLTAESPTFSLPTFPDLPDYTNPVVPDFLPVSVPSPPVANIPSFDITAEFPDLGEVTHEFDYFEEALVSAMESPLTAVILDWLNNGVSALNPEAEQAIFDRARDRESEIADSSISEILNTFASRGFSIPPGPAQDAINKVIQKKQDTLSSAARDTLIKQADLSWQREQFTVEQARAVYQLELDFHNAVRERALNVQKSLAEFAVQIYNARVAKHDQIIKELASRSDLFKTQIDSAISELEIYKGKLEESKMSIASNQSSVDLYKAQLEGAANIVALYKAEMEAAHVYAGIQRLWFETYEAQVRAYVSEVEGAKAEADVQQSRLALQVEQARTKLAYYQALVDGYKANIELNTAELRAQLEKYQVDASVFGTEITNILKAYEVTMDSDRINLSAELDAEKLNLGYVEAQVSNIKNILAVRHASGAAGASMYIDIAKAALALHTALQSMTSQLIQTA